MNHELLSTVTRQLKIVAVSCVVALSAGCVSNSSKPAEDTGSKPESSRNDVSHPSHQRFDCNGHHDPKASAEAWECYFDRDPRKKLSNFLFNRVRASHVVGNHSAAGRWGAIYDWLCANFRIPGKEWYYDHLHATTELEKARARNDSVRIYLRRHGYTEADTPSSVARTLADRSQPSGLSKEAREDLQRMIVELRASQIPD